MLSLSIFAFNFLTFGTRSPETPKAVGYVDFFGYIQIGAMAIPPRGARNAG
jgi:hypothetical protein